MQFIQEACLTNLLFGSILMGPHHKPFGFTWDRLANHKPSFDTHYNYEDTQLLLEMSFICTDSHAYGLPFNVPNWLTNHELKYDVCPVELISKGIPESGYNDPAPVVNVFYAEGSNLLFVVFVGTSNICMGALDAAYHQTELVGINHYIPGMKGHRGVYAIYNSIRDKLIRTLTPYLPRNPQIIITGHSLGGGVSQICALDLSEYDPIHYSFAAPMIFNGLGYEAFNRTVKYSYRIANGSDLITLAPLPVMPNKDVFYHVGQLVYFQRNFGDYPQNHTLAYVQEYGLVE